jgi:hypothetical protein
MISIKIGGLNIYMKLEIIAKSTYCMVEKTAYRSHESVSLIANR